MKKILQAIWICIQVAGVSIAIAAIWVNNQLGGIFGGSGAVQQMYAALQLAPPKIRRVIKTLPYMIGLSLILITVGLRTDPPNKPLLFLVFTFWALASWLFLFCLDIIAQRFSAVKGLLHSVGMLCLFMFWCSFMSLTGALMWYGWERSTEILLFLVFMNVSGVITASKVPWARWLMEWSIWIVLFLSVVPYTSVPLFKGVRNLAISFAHRGTVEVNNAVRGINPDMIEDIEPDSYYQTGGETSYFACNDCMDVTRTGKPPAVVVTKTLNPAKIGSSGSLSSNTWLAQVPEYQDPVVYNLRNFLVMYLAQDNNPDKGFVVNKAKMVLIPVNAKIVARKTVGDSKSGVTEAVGKIPLWAVALFGVIATFTGLFFLIRYIVRRARKANAAGQAAAAAQNTPGVPATPAPAGNGGHRHGGWKKTVAIALVITTLGLLGFIAYAVSNNPAPTTIAAYSATPAVAVVVQPSAPAPTSAAPATPAPTAPAVDMDWAKKVHANVADWAHSSEENYTFELLNRTANSFDYLLDGRVRLVDQYAVDENDNRLALAPGDTVSFDADPNSRICEHNDPCAGPLGQAHGNKPSGYNQQEWAAYKLGEYPVANAVIGELCAIVGQVRIGVGLHASYTVPQGAGVVSVRLGANIRDRFTPLAHAGQRVIVTINPSN